MDEETLGALGDRGALLGLDVGAKTIGVASCDPDRTVATPVEVIRRAKFAADAARLETLIGERKAVGLVIGLPLHMDGSEGPSAQRARAFGRNFAARGGLPVAFWDERFSTAAMERDLIAIDVSRKRRAEQIDAAAAAFILQGALDRLRAIAARGAP